MSVCCVCCVLSGTVLCDEIITRPEESYRLCCVVYGLENFMNEEALTHWRLSHQKQICNFQVFCFKNSIYGFISTGIPVLLLSCLLHFLSS
jgi:hypothetical protein